MARIFRIFLVEDDSHISNTLTELLTAIPNVEVVMCATSERLAIDWLAENQTTWNLAVVDLALGDGSGLRVLSACRVRKIGQKMVVLSNLLSKEMRRRCASFGADASFDKTSDIDEVLAYCRTASEAASLA